jgi:hypothetical protein
VAQVSSSPELRLARDELRVPVWKEQDAVNEWPNAGAPRSCRFLDIEHPPAIPFSETEF